MTVLRRLESFEDDRGNRIEYTGDAQPASVSITFTGSGNIMRVGNRPRLGKLSVVFDCDNGELTIGPGSGKLSLQARLGQDSRIRLGKGVTSTNLVLISATEGTSVVVGDDVMFASQNQVRADDAHPIFDVRSGRRVNVSRDIVIGSHVWLAWGACVLGGSVIGDGSVLGMGAILKGRVPNNAIAVGSPARVVRRHIAWERPHLSRVAPFYKPDASTVKKSAYWNLTKDDDREPAEAVEGGTKVRSPVKPSIISRIKRRLSR